MLLQLLKFYTMLFIPSSPSPFVGHKRKLAAISCSTQITLFILCFLVHSNQAGVIKKRDTVITETHNGNTEAEVEPTILTTPNNATDSPFTIKLQSVTVPSFTRESSKEVTNNEILINETKKLLEETEIKDKANNETLSNREGEAQVGISTKPTDNFQDFQHIIQTLESKQNDLHEAVKTASEFSSNDIKEENFRKLKEKSTEDKGSSLILESSFKDEDKDPRPPSKLLTELRTETEEPFLQTNNQNKQLDNSIESSQETINQKLQNKAENFDANIMKTLETTTQKTSANGDNKMLETSINSFTVKETEYPLKSTESSTSVPQATNSLEVLKMNTIVPLKDSESEDKTKSTENSVKPEDISSQKHQSNIIYNGLDHQDQKKYVLTTTNPLLTVTETISKPITKDEELSIFNSDKKEYARSMSIEETTTLKRGEGDEESTSVTTFKPAKETMQEGITEPTQETSQNPSEILNKTDFVPSNTKEKKPKFINDNSTNAQQLNLPNNAEVWSLAGMKSLPKSNITMETAQTQNETNKDLATQHNTSMTLNNNSEKNLLDWSQIMMDRELSITARNEMNERNDQDNNKDSETVPETSSFVPISEMTQYTLQAQDDVITIKSLIEQESSTSTISPASTSTILSPASYTENNYQLDKKVEENMNNHIDMLTATTTTSATTNVDNNPFNTSLNIEPNLNEINLTSNQTKVDLNNDVHTITTAGKKTVGDDVKADADIHTDTSTVTATPTATIMISTTATAVHNMATVEQISSETTTVSTLETAKQNASSSNVITSQQQQQQITNLTKNVNDEETNSSLSASHNELDNTVIDKKQINQYENIDLITKTTTTAIPITTFRPTILAITSTTSLPATFEQEVDQKNNEIQTNSTNTEQQSIIKTDLHFNHSTKATETNLKGKEFEIETTTLAALTTTAAAEQLTISKNKNTLTSSPWENEITTTTSYAEDNIINETTETNSNLSETTNTTTQTTLKQLNEQKNTADTETTTGSAVLVNEKFEKGANTITNTATTTTTTETNLSSNTSTETPVVADTESGKQLSESITPTESAVTTTTTTVATTEQNIIATTTEKQKGEHQKNNLTQEDVQTQETTTKTMNNTQDITTTTTTMPSRATTVKEEETYISLLDDTTTTTQAYTPTSTITTTSSSHTTPKTTTTTTATSSTLPSAVTTKVEEIYNVINSTTTEVIQTTTQPLLTEIEEESSNDPSSTSTLIYLTEMLPPATTTPSSQMIPAADIGRSLPTLTSIMGGNSGNMYSKNSETSGETDVNVIIAITVSVIGVIALILLVGFLYLMRKRQKQTSYSQRCRPVSLDEYTIDNASVSGSMRKSSALRASKRTYGNLAFDDPTLRHNPMGVQELAKFVQEKLRIFEEFRDVPQITSRLDEVPTGCEDKNRYANVLPLPETRVILQRLNNDEKSEYINANYVTGPKDPPNYYIACQAPLESTVEDFWRMIWEQQSRVIIQATDLIEIGVEKCAEYLPPSVTLDNHSCFGDFQITLQNREVKDKYAISTILLKHVGENATRELTHYWYKWPEVGVPIEEAPIIAMLLEARSSLISYAIEQANEDKEKSSMATLKSAEEGTVTTNISAALPTNNSNGSSANGSTGEINGNISMVHIKKAARNQGPLTVHCSPGTGRTGTIIACDIAIRSLETPKRTVDIPQIVYYVRRGRASAVLIKEQYEFIYKVANMYAAKITNPTSYN